MPAPAHPVFLLFAVIRPSWGAPAGRILPVAHGTSVQAFPQVWCCLFAFYLACYVVHTQGFKWCGARRAPPSWAQKGCVNPFCASCMGERTSKDRRYLSSFLQRCSSQASQNPVLIARSPLIVVYKMPEFTSMQVMRCEMASGQGRVPNTRVQQVPRTTPLTLIVPACSDQVHAHALGGRSLQQCHKHHTRSHGRG